MSEPTRSPDAAKGHGSPSFVVPFCVLTIGYLILVGIAAWQGWL